MFPISSLTSSGAAELQPVSRTTETSAVNGTSINAVGTATDAPAAASVTVDLSPVAGFLLTVTNAQEQLSQAPDAADNPQRADTVNTAVQNVVDAFNLLPSVEFDQGQPQQTSLLNSLVDNLTRQTNDGLTSQAQNLAQLGVTLQPPLLSDLTGGLSLEPERLRAALNANSERTTSTLQDTLNSFRELATQFAEQLSAAGSSQLPGLAADPFAALSPADVAANARLDLVRATLDTLSQNPLRETAGDRLAAQRAQQEQRLTGLPETPSPILNQTAAQQAQLNNATQAATEQSALQTAQQAAEQATQQTALQTAQQATQQTALQAAQQTALQAAQQTALQAAQQTAQQAAQQTAQQAAQQATQPATQQAPQQAAQQAEQDAGAPSAAEQARASAQAQTVRQQAGATINTASTAAQAAQQQAVAAQNAAQSVANVPVNATPAQQAEASQTAAAQVAIANAAAQAAAVQAQAAQNAADALAAQNAAATAAAAQARAAQNNASTSEAATTAATVAAQQAAAAQETAASLAAANAAAANAAQQAAAAASAAQQAAAAQAAAEQSGAAQALAARNAANAPTDPLRANPALAAAIAAYNINDVAGTDVRAAQARASVIPAVGAVSATTPTRTIGTGV